jgi:hypothetical protein
VHAVTAPLEGGGQARDSVDLNPLFAK